MANNLIPNPPQSNEAITKATPGWARKLSKLFFGFLVRESTGNVLYDALLAAGRAIVKILINAGVIAYFAHYWAGISFDALIVGGIFVAAFAALILTQLIGRLLRPKGASQVPALAPTLAQTSAAEAEEFQRRIKELKEDNDALQISLGFKISELESHKWLYELADSDKRFIDNFVKVLGCEIGGHDLLSEQYVEFKFAILNASVYDVEIGEDDRKVKGDTYLNSRQLSRDKSITKDSIRHYKHGERGSLMVRHWLSSEEVKDFLGGPNKAGEFQLHGLEIAIKGGSPESGVIPKNLGFYGLSVSGKSLWELYRELEIEIEQATFTAYWNFEQGIQKGMTIPAFYGFLINMRVRIVNPRPKQITLRGCHLTVKIKGKEYAADAETGAVIYQDRMISKGEQILRGEKFENLNPTYLHPHIIEAKDEYTGHLQFILGDAPQFGEDEEKGPVSATLSISDASGEIHRAEGQLSYVTSYKL